MGRDWDNDDAGWASAAKSAKGSASAVGAGFSLGDNKETEVCRRKWIPTYIPR